MAVGVVRIVLKRWRNPPKHWKPMLDASRIMLDQWNREHEKDPYRALIAILGTEELACAWMTQQLASRKARMLPEATGETADAEARGHRDDSGEPQTSG